MAAKPSFRNLRIIIGVVVAIGLVILPLPNVWSNGVFFPQSQFTLDIILGAISTCIAALLVFSRAFRIWATTGESVRYSDVAVLGLVFLYVIALFYSSSMNLAVEGALNYVALLLLYFAFRITSLRKFAGTWGGIGFVVASVTINIIGLANGWGQLPYASATETAAGGQIEISSVFQYHNAFAAFAASTAIGLLVWGAKTRAKWWYRCCSVALASLSIVSLLASGSRGALAIWAVLMILVAVGLRDSNDAPFAARNRFLGDSYFAIIGGLIGYELIHSAISSKNPLEGWLGIVLSIVLPAFLVFARLMTARMYSRISPRHGLLMHIAIGLLAAIFGVLIKYHAITQKLSSYNLNQLSVSQRFIFWGDGLRILLRNPISGSGAGAWQAMYMKVQSYPYTSNQAHSFGVDTLIDTGVLGALCLIALVWPMFRQVIWPSRNSLDTAEPVRYAFVAGALMLFCHSLMDWDMPFEYLLMLFFAGIGAAATTSPIVRFNWIHRWIANRGFSFGIGIVTAAMAIVSLGGAIGTSIANGAARQSASDAVKSYRTAYHLQPYNSDDLVNAAIVLLRTSASQSDELTAERWIRASERLDPYTYSTASTYAQLAYDLGEYKTAFEQAQLAAENAPFKPANMSLALTAGTVYGLQDASKNPKATRSAFMKVIEMYQQSLGYKTTIAALPSYLPPSTPYTLDDFSVVSVAACEYAVGYTESAEELAATELSSSDQLTRDTAQLIQTMVQNPAGVQPYVSAHSDIRQSYDLLERATKALRH